LIPSEIEQQQQNKMVFINLPPNLTEEEELLRQKYVLLRKKVLPIRTQQPLNKTSKTCYY